MYCFINRSVESRDIGYKRHQFSCFSASRDEIVLGFTPYRQYSSHVTALLKTRKCSSVSVIEYSLIPRPFSGKRINLEGHSWSLEACHGEAVHIIIKDRLH